MISYYDLNSNHSYIISIKLCRDFDNRIISLINRSLIEDFSSSDNVINLVLEEVKELSRLYLGLFNEIYNRYLATRVNCLPNLDDVFFVAMSRIIKSLENPKAIQYLISKAQMCLNRIKMHLTYKLLEFFLLPDEIQYIYAEIIFSVNDPTKTFIILDFIYKYSFDKLEQTQISAELSNKFVRKALQNPFRKVLNGFIPDKTQLRSFLEIVSPKIYLVTMPARIFGITLKNQTIAIKIFKEETENEGATFVIYMHELARFLRRVDCQKINETSKRISDGIKQGSEGGFSLEEMLFGAKLLYIYDEAGAFILEENMEDMFNKSIQESLKISDAENGSSIDNPVQRITLIQAFQTEFHRRNTPNSKCHKIDLCKYGNAIMLGTCATIYGL